MKNKFSLFKHADLMVVIRGNYLLLFAGLISCLACNSDRQVDVQEFRFQKNYVNSFPSDLEIPALLEAVNRRLDSLEAIRQELLLVDTLSLSRKGKTQHRLLLQRVDGEWDRWEPYRTNPALYDLGGLLRRHVDVERPNSAPLRHLQELSQLLDLAADYYDLARTNLVVQDVGLYRQAAQKQYQTLAFLQEDLSETLRSAALEPKEKAQFLSKIGQARLPVKDYLAFCNSMINNIQDSTRYVSREKRQR